MDRRKFIKASGAVAASLAAAGCMGGNEGTGNQGGGPGEANQNDQGDNPIVPQEPGWFGIDGGVYEEQAADNLKITQHSLYRTSEAFGVQGTVKNTGTQPYTRVVAHARLLNANDEEIGSFRTVFGDKDQQEAFDDLAPGEKLRFDIRFKNTNPSEVFTDKVSYQTWATGEVK